MFVTHSLSRRGVKVNQLVTLDPVTRSRFGRIYDGFIGANAYDTIQGNVCKWVNISRPEAFLEGSVENIPVVGFLWSAVVGVVATINPFDGQDFSDSVGAVGGSYGVFREGKGVINDVAPGTHHGDARLMFNAALKHLSGI